VIVNVSQVGIIKFDDVFFPSLGWWYRNDPMVIPPDLQRIDTM
jgi:hypothetical protein